MDDNDPERAHADPTPAKTSEAPARERDLVYVHSAVGEGAYLVLRQRDGQIEAGELRPLKEGAAIHGDVVKLHPKNEDNRLFDVEVLMDAPTRTAHSGPPQVATDAYRRHYDTIFAPTSRGRSRDDLPN